MGNQQSQAVKANASSVLIAHFRMSGVEFIPALCGQDRPAIFYQDCPEIARTTEKANVDIHRHVSEAVQYANRASVPKKNALEGTTLFGYLQCIVLLANEQAEAASLPPSSDQADCHAATVTPHLFPQFDR